MHGKDGKHPASFLSWYRCHLGYFVLLIVLFRRFGYGRRSRLLSLYFIDLAKSKVAYRSLVACLPQSVSDGHLFSLIFICSLSQDSVCQCVGRVYQFICGLYTVHDFSC